MKNSIALTALAIVLSSGTVVAALTPAVPHPLTQKYRDQGAHAATGRSGNAAIEARALLAKDRTTQLEITTGHLDSTANGAGVLAKLQNKIAYDGGSVQTDNAKTTSGYASFTYNGLHRNQNIQVQANVTGVDSNRTDVVTVQTEVKLRPDLAAVTITAPSQARVNAPVNIDGAVAEVNGDVGATTTCRLFADGAEVARIAGIWVDAGSSVACHFQTAFSSPGTKQLALRVTDVVPADYDAADDQTTASITIVDDAQPFAMMGAFSWDYRVDHTQHDTANITSPNGVVTSTWSYDYIDHEHIQIRGASGQFNGASSVDTGTITLTETSDADPNGILTVNVADMQYRSDYGYAQCRYGVFDSGVVASICSFDYGTSAVTGVSAVVENLDTYYFVDHQGTGWWAGNDYTNTITQKLGSFVNLGTIYSATLTHTSDTATHSGTMDVVRDQSTNFGFDIGPYCSTTSAWSSDGSTQTSCYDDHFRYTATGGDHFRYTNP